MNNNSNYRSKSSYNQKKQMMTETILLKEIRRNQIKEQAVQKELEKNKDQT